MHTFSNFYVTGYTFLGEIFMRQGQGVKGIVAHPYRFYSQVAPGIWD